MWDFITMIPSFWTLTNAIDWAMVFGGLFLVSEALAAIPWFQSNSVFQTIYNFLKKYKKD